MEEDLFEPYIEQLDDDHVTPGGANESEPEILIENGREIIRFPDGSVHIGEFGDDESNETEQDPNNFDQNLAFVLDEHFLEDLGLELNELIDDDQESQMPFMTTLSDCIDLLGLNPDNGSSSGSGPFPNSSDVNSMALFETSLHLESIIYNSIFDDENFITSVIVGQSTPELENCAQRKQMYFNNYFNNVAPELKKEARKSTKWFINAGSNYKKVYIDPILNRPTSVCILPQDFIVNRSYPTHLVAPRKTHVFKVSERDLLFYIKKKIFREVDLGQYQSYNEEDPLTEVLNDISSIEEAYFSDDNPADRIYRFRECHCLIEIPNDIFAQDVQIPLPYIVTLEEESGKIVKIVRSWKENDPHFTPRQYFVNYSCMPSFDGEGYGLVHYAKRLGDAATGMTRLLVNSAIWANYPGGIYDNSMRLDNADFKPSPGEFKGINTNGRSIQEVIMPLPYKDPSPVFREVLQDIENTIRRPAAIISEEMVSTASKAPMGTVLFMFENAQRIPNMLLQNFYESFKQELFLLNQRFYDWLPDNQMYPFKVPGGEMVIMKEDFNENVMVVPQAETSLKSTSYGFIQAQSMMETAMQGAQFHNMPEAYKIYYRAMGFTDEQINTLVVQPPQQQPPFSGDPVTENMHLLTGKPVTATLPQDHPSHIITHTLILMDPNTPPEIQAATKAHIQEHHADSMLIEMQTAMGIEIPQEPTQMSMEEQNQIALLAAQVAQQKIEEMKAQMQPPPPAIDPVLAQIEIEKMIVSQKQATDELRHQYEMDKLMLEKERLDKETELAYQKLQLDDKKIEFDYLIRENKRESDEHTEFEKIRVMAKQKSAKE